MMKIMKNDEIKVKKLLNKKLETKITRNNYSLKTTIPKFLIYLFDINQGDKLEWIIEKDKNIILLKIIKEVK